MTWDLGIVLGATPVAVSLLFGQSLLADIFSALAFRHALEDRGAVVTLSSQLSGGGIPVAALAFAHPFRAGLLTGLMPTTFSIGFSVAVPLVAADDGTISRAWARGWLPVASSVRWSRRSTSAWC
jgi:hypothetical protein